MNDTPHHTDPTNRLSGSVGSIRRFWTYSYATLGALVLVVGITAWFIVDRELVEGSSVVESEAGTVAGIVNHRIKCQDRFVELLAYHMSSGLCDEAFFHQLIDERRTEHAEFEGILWVDSALNPVWTAPDELSSAALPANPEGMLPRLDDGQDGGFAEAVHWRTKDLSRDDYVLAVCMPVYRDSRFVGAFIAYTSCQRLLSGLRLNETHLISRHNHLSLVNPGGQVIASLPINGALESDHMLHFPIGARGYDLMLRVTGYRPGIGRWVWITMGILGLLLSVTAFGALWMLRRDDLGRRQVEQALSASEEKFRVLSDQSQLGVVVARDDKIIYANRAAVDILALTGDDLANFSSNELKKRVHEHDWELLRARFRKEMSQTNPNGGRTVFRMSGKDGTVRWIETHFRKVAIGDGYAIHSTLLDITSRRIAEQALKAERDYSTMILDSAPVVICRLKPDGTVTYINPAGEQISGYSAGELVGRNWFKTVYPGDKQSDINKVIQDLLRTDLHRHERVITTRDGRNRIIEWVLLVRRDSNGDPIELMGFGNDITDRMRAQYQLQTAHDQLETCVNERTWELKQAVVRLEQEITERRRAEDELKRSKQRYQDVVENARECITVARDGIFCYVNPMLAEISGYTEEELLSRPFLDLAHPDDRDRLAEIYRKRLCGEDAPDIYHFRGFHKCGDTRWMEIKSVQLDWEGEPAVLSFISDITERKQAEDALVRAERNYRELHENIRDGYSKVDMDGRILKMNPAALEVLGYTLDELKGVKYEDITPEEWWETEEKIIREQVMVWGYSQVYGKEYITKDGTIVPVELRAYLVRDENGDPECMWAVSRDITERKQAEQALRESEARYEELLNGVLEGIGIVDAEEVFQYCNPAMAEIFGETSTEKLQGRNLLDYVAPETRELILTQTARRKQNLTSRYTLDIVTSQGDIRTISASVSPRFDSTGEYIGAFGSTIDITAHMRAEAALKESEEQFRTLSEQSLMGLAIMTDDIFEYVNNAFADILECDPSEILNFTYEEMAARIHPEDRPMVLEQLRKKLSREVDVVSRYEFRILTKSGQVKFIENYSRPIQYRGRRAVFVNFVDISRRMQVQQSLEEANRRLEAEQAALTEKNIVLKGVLEQFDEEKRQTGLQVQANVDRLVMPVIRKLEDTGDKTQENYLLSLRHGLEEITSPFVSKLESRYVRLTPREIEICGMIKDGLTSKDIAHSLHTSIETVRNQRKNIRKKLDIANDKINLSTFLQSV